MMTPMILTRQRKLPKNLLNRIRWDVFPKIDWRKDGDVVIEPFPLEDGDCRDSKNTFARVYTTVSKRYFYTFYPEHCKDKRRKAFFPFSGCGRVNLN